MTIDIQPLPTEECAAVYIAHVMETGECYVGGSVRVLHRINRQHKNGHQSNRNLIAATQLYGASGIAWGILELVDDIEQLREREGYWISKLKPTLNVMQVTRDGVHSHNDGTKLKMSAALKSRNHPTRVFTDEQVMLIDALLADFPAEYIADQLNVRRYSIDNIKWGFAYNHLTNRKPPRATPTA